MAFVRPSSNAVLLVTASPARYAMIRANVPSVD
jgi:hypothetical protein